MIVKITFRGKTQCITAWAKELGMVRGTLNDRLMRLHWPIERALTEKMRDPHAERGPRKSDELLLSLYRGRTQSYGRKKHKHVAIAEKAIGKPLPLGAVVHHINYNKLDNRTENLVICPDHAYHMLLHLRTDALAACGNANHRWCSICDKYDDPANMHKSPRERSFRHVACSAVLWSRRAEKASVARRLARQENNSR